MQEVFDFFSGRPLQSGTLLLIVLTLIAGAVVTPLVKFLLVQFLRPFTWFLKVTYRKVAFKNPLNVSVRAYRRHLLKAFSSLDTPVGPRVEIPFEKAYVPLRLLSKDEDPLDLLEFARTCNRCIIVGGPGTGKTTLMKSLVLATLRGASSSRMLPVFVTLRKLAKKSHTVEQAMAASLHEHGFPDADEFLHGAFENGRLLLVLDGLDEVAAQREFTVSQIKDFCDRDAGLARRNSIYVTCREAGYHRDDLGDAIRELARVEPFSSRQMRDFLRAWPLYRGRSVLALYDQVQQDPHARDLCRNPLLLTLLAGLYLESTEFELPTSRNAFFAVALGELLSRRAARRNIPSRYTQDTKLALLQRASLQQLVWSERDADPEVLTPAALERAAREIDKSIDRAELTAELDLDGALRHIGENSYTFAHRTFQEYLGAREASRTLTSEEVLASSRDRPELAEMLAFYCGMLQNLPELDRVLGTLIRDRPPRVAARALLFSADGISAELVESLSGKLAMRTGEVATDRSNFELLASIAQRRGRSFEPARRAFQTAVTEFVGTSSSDSAVELEMALAASPETALRVLPAVLASDNDAYKRAAVRVLLGLDTEDSLDQLVRLLDSGDPIVRNEAANSLLSIADSRAEELRARSDLVATNHADAALWPFAAFFPASVAVGIANNLEPHTEEDSPFHLTARALRSSHAQDPGSNRFLLQWRIVAMQTAAFRALCRANQMLARALLGVGFSVCAIVTLTTLCLQLSGTSLVVGFDPFQIEISTAAQKRVLWRAAEPAYRALQVTYRPQSIPPPPNKLVELKRALLTTLGRPVQMPPAVPKEFEQAIWDLKGLAEESWFGVAANSIPALQELARLSGHELPQTAVQQLSQITYPRVAVGDNRSRDLVRCFFAVLGMQFLYMVYRLGSSGRAGASSLEPQTLAVRVRRTTADMLGWWGGQVIAASAMLWVQIVLLAPWMSFQIYQLVTVCALFTALPALVLRCPLVPYSRQHRFFSGTIRVIVDPRYALYHDAQTRTEAEQRLVDR